jgi:UDP-3-O-[3-hydroxymyristoyl] glucosamine N-acyltransferase
MAALSGENSASGDGHEAVTAGVVSDLVGGELRGDADAIVSGVAPLHRAGPHHVSFLASARYVALAERAQAGVLLVAPELAETRTGARALVVVERPHEAMLKLIPRFHRAPERVPGIHPTARIGRGAIMGADVTIEEYAVIGAGAAVGDRVWIGPHAVVGDGATVGADCALYAHSTLYSGTELGERVIVQSGARVGSDGFGYVFRDGQHARVPHVGRCVVGDDVEIGANTTIDRGSIDDTVIGAGTKIDNLVQIGHNVKIGRLCLLMAQVGIAGSAQIEDGVILAGQAGINGHITIGAGARIAGQAGVFGDVPAGESWSGYPARRHRESLRASAAVEKLVRIIARLERLLEERGR